MPPPSDDFFRAADLMNVIERYLSEEEVKRVYDAFVLASDAHKHVVRLSGEPYITHPLEVARFLANMHMDADTISAALLHDVIEDTHYTQADIEAHFGKVVAHLVNGVTKLEGSRFENKQEATIASFQKMMEAMTDDFRVVIIKLADRLHNLRTLHHKKPESRRRIARETISMYIPLASRMGMNEMRREMQQLSFEHLYPWRSRILQDSLDNYLSLNEVLHQNILNRVTQAMLGISGSMVFTWQKNPYLIYERIRRYGKSVSEKRETLSIRVIVGTVDECYRTLGILHSLYSPKIGGFYDFISTPKTYGFQALQTSVITPSKRKVRFQIQTRSMYQVERYGIAAQWRYPDIHSKTRAHITQDALESWLEQVRDLGRKARNAREFYTDMQTDLFLTEIYAFTPNGEVKEFPRGSTIIDFAYAIHTEVGQHCTHALIDGEKASLRERIPNGATIEVITSPNTTPKDFWLNFAATARAQSNIRSWLRQKQHSEHHELGRQLLNQALQERGSDLEQTIAQEDMQKLLETLRFKKAEDLYYAISTGEQCPRLLAARLTQDNALNSDKASPLLVQGSSGMRVDFDSCCYPLPNESILGRLNTQNKALEVHHENCPIFLSNTPAEQVLSVAWAKPGDEKQYFLTRLQTQAYNVVGALHSMTELMHHLNVNIESIHTSGDNNIKDTDWTLWVRDLHHLQEVIHRLEHISPVIRVTRLREGENSANQAGQA